MLFPELETQGMPHDVGPIAACYLSIILKYMIRQPRRD